MTPYRGLCSKGGCLQTGIATGMAQGACRGGLDVRWTLRESVLNDKYCYSKLIFVNKCITMKDK